MLEYIHPQDACAENILEWIAAHETALIRLRQMLPLACEKEGHVWDNAEGVLVSICTRKGCWEEADPDCTPTFGSRDGHWAIEPEHEDVFQRKCTRCGKIENKQPIKLGVRSPWSKR